MIYQFSTAKGALKAFEEIRVIYHHQCVVADWVDALQDGAEIEQEYLRLLQRAETGERGVARGATIPITPIRHRQGMWGHKSCSGNTRFAWQKCQVEYVCETQWTPAPG